MSEVDVFSPFRKRAEPHEDRLTWGLMVALKYVPELQRVLRDMVLHQLPAGRWPSDAGWEPAIVSTQTSRVGVDTSFVVSVFLSDASLATPIEVHKSERTARYDGVVQYPDGLTLVLENKPRRGGMWKEQLSPSRKDLPSDVDLYGRAVSLEWADVLESFLKFTTSQVASFPARSLAEDFLAFAEDFHSALSPYRTFELCANRRAALDKRVKLLLHEMGNALGYEVGTRPGDIPYLDLPNDAVRQVHLTVHGLSGDEGLALRENIWPGDTVKQVRPFLRQVDRDAFLQLEVAGWKVQPNLHFSYIQRHLVWADTSLSSGDYLDYFAANPDEIGRKSLDGEILADMITNWRRLGLISSSDEAKLWREFGETQRPFLNVVPGFSLSREWPMETVVELEAESRLADELIDALRVPLATWGESIP